MDHGDRPLTIEVFLGRHGSAWRLYVAETSWLPPELHAKLDEHREAVLVSAPDLEELDRYMWKHDSPYQKREVKFGGVELLAKGRSAIHLAGWLTDLLGS